MNFVLTKNPNYKNVFNLNCRQFYDFYFFHDAQWTLTKDMAHKGLSNNFCEIKFSKDNISLNHNGQRDFPLWYDHSTCSNIVKLENYLPADAKINYDNGWHVTYNKDLVATDDYILTGVAAKEFIRSVLIDNVTKFVETNSLPLMMPNSNGLDIMLTRSIFDYLKIEYNLFDIEPRHNALQKYLYEKYYGFIQIQQFSEPTCLISGFYGDEYLLRSPSQTQMLIEKDIVELFDSTPKSYMKYFFNKIYREKCKKIKKTTKQKVKELIYNDIQVWHVDNTFVFTPFKDTRLLKLLNCDENMIIEQTIHGKLSKDLINFFNPALIGKIDTEKNVVQPKWFPL
jgi:hypothetical protein|tara:strand:- start:184 stop:1203 length:1020 start_codon:yes stop_codon:yes gene_type:complete